MMKTDLDTFLKFIDQTGEQKHFRTVEIEGLDWTRERKMRKEMSEMKLVDRNSGLRNSGDFNSGHRNSGDFNSGGFNSGDLNSGSWNSGDWNSGNCNSGDFNITDGNSGCFCTETHTIKFFDKDSNWTLEDWRMSKAYRLLRSAPLSPVKWIPEVDITDEEKAEHPEYTITGGYLKKLSLEERAEAAQKWWDSLDADGKQTIKNIPNFDPVKFKQITGIEVD